MPPWPCGMIASSRCPLALGLLFPSQEQSSQVRGHLRVHDIPATTTFTGGSRSEVLNDSFKTSAHGAAPVACTGATKPGDFAGTLSSDAVNDSFMASRRLFAGQQSSQPQQRAVLGDADG